MLTNNIGKELTDWPFLDPGLILTSKPQQENDYFSHRCCSLYISQKVLRPIVGLGPEETSLVGLSRAKEWEQLENTEQEEDLAIIGGAGRAIRARFQGFLISVVCCVCVCWPPESGGAVCLAPQYRGVVSLGLGSVQNCSVKYSTGWLLSCGGWQLTGEQIKNCPPTPSATSGSCCGGPAQGPP